MEEWYNRTSFMPLALPLYPSAPPSAPPPSSRPPSSSDVVSTTSLIPLSPLIL